MYYKSKLGEIIDLSKTEGFQYKNPSWHSIINQRNIIYLILGLFLLVVLYLIFKKK